jgi:hypothetical protein
MSQISSFLVNGSPGSGIQTLSGNTGGPRFPVGGNVNILGAGAISVSGAGNTLTISISGGGGVDTITGDTGGAISPTAGNINLVGSGGISVNGSGSTLTISGSFLSTLSFVTDSGTAVSSGGIIGVDGIHGINTSAGANQFFIAIDNSITLGDLAVVPTALTAVTGNIAIVAGNLTLPNTTLITGAQGSITLGGTRFLSNQGTSNTFLGANAGSLLLSSAFSTFNAALGASALAGLFTGSQNTAVGALAGRDISSGFNNVAIGATALQNLTTGSSNIGIGQGAGTAITGEGSNILIGHAGVVGVSGLVAIGTFASNYGTNNTFIGTSAGNYTFTFGDAVANSGFGEFSLTALTTGSGNTAIGSFAGIDITTGDNNTLLGADAAVNLITGSTNIAIGYQSGSSLTGAESSNILIAHSGVVGVSNLVAIGTFASNYGTNNTFVGTSAGNYTLTTGDAVANSGFGEFALAALTTGSGNTAIGSFAGTDITTGDNNVLLGTDAAASLTTGSGNIAIGYQAGSGLTGSESNNVLVDTSVAGVTGYTGLKWFGGILQNYGTRNIFAGGSGNLTLTVGSATDNVAMGDGALAGLTTGDSNVVIGVDAGELITTGDENIAIGIRALNDLTTGDDNIGIGFNAGANLTGAESNNILIGPAGSKADGVTGYSGLVAIQNVFHNYGRDNIFVGASAGNLTMDDFNAPGNTGVGVNALNSLASTGERNMALGTGALQSLTNGIQNVAVGALAMNALVDGDLNTAIGEGAGGNLAGSESGNLYLANVGVFGESDAIRIGENQSTAYIVGVLGVTVGVSGVPVVIDNADQLGTVVSSIRYKENIRNMNGDSEAIYKMRPVVYNYKKDPAQDIRYGLIAEEVEEVMPSMVSYNKDGTPESVKYLDLPVMLLNELQKLRKEVQELREKMGECCG